MKICGNEGTPLVYVLGKYIVLLNIQLCSKDVGLLLQKSAEKDRIKTKLFAIGSTQKSIVLINTKITIP